MEDLNIRPYDNTKGLLRMGDASFSKKLYALRSFWSPGTVIIFNHYDFSKTKEKLKNRLGTHKDVEALQHLFKEFKFKVYRYDDPTRDELIEKLNEHVSNGWWRFSGSIVLIVLTHGEENGMLWASDHKYHCSQLWDPILQCDKLREKFKFIILQACRGTKREKKFDLLKLKVVTHNEDKVDSDNISIQMRNDRKSCTTKLSEKALPDNAINLLIAHSSVEGCESLRDTEKGTWYVLRLCEVIKDWAKSELNRDLLESMTTINERMNIMMKHNDSLEGQTSSFTSFLRDNIVYRKSKEFFSHGVFILPKRRYKGRAYIYYDKNHKNEATKFEDTMDKLLLLPIVVEIDHGETALQEIYNVSNKNDFYHEQFIVFAIFTKCETIISNNVPLREIYENFSAEKCPSLAGQCKLFFFFDAKYEKILDDSMDYSSRYTSHYITNHCDFLIVRGHSKEFFENVNEQLLLTYENSNHHIIQILTVAMRHESKTKNGYTSNFESTLCHHLLLLPSFGAQLPRQLLEEKKIQAPVFQNIELKQPVKSFTGRDDDIKTLRCETSYKSQGRQLIRVSGPSGIGKTQLVSFFVTYFAWMFNNIIWINAENEQTILKSFQETAIGFHFYNWYNVISDINKLYNIIRRYLNENTNLKTLFVFDNYTEIASKYIFDDIGSREIYYIITTNITNVFKDCISINIELFNERESIELLTKLLTKSTKSDLGILAKELNNMPIFLHLAASIIIESQLSNPDYKISDFLSELLLTPGIILNKKVPLEICNAPFNNKYSTICELKILQVEKRNKLAQIILYIICYCNPDDIPLNIFQYFHNSRSKENIETNREINEKKVNIAISILTDENIINRNKNKGNVHRLIQEYIRFSLHDNGKESKLLLIVLNLIHYLLQSSLMSKEFALHAITIFKHALKYIDEFDNHVQTAIMLATYLKNNSMENVARDFLTECHQVFELKFGVNSQECISIRGICVGNFSA